MPHWYVELHFYIIWSLESRLKFTALFDNSELTVFIEIFIAVSVLVYEIFIYAVDKKLG